MKFRAGLLWMALTCLPQLALAARPPGEVGALQAVYDFCAKIDPSQRGDFDRQADSLFRGLTAAEIAAMRHSGEYKRGYQMLAGILPGVNQPVQACHAISGAPAPQGPPPGAKKRPHS
jgi:hypothetical protein